MPAPFITQVAGGVPFSNVGNGFVSTDVQAAIEEAKASAIAKIRFTIVTTFNNVIQNNMWLSYGDTIPGNIVPIHLPMACKLKELTFGFDGVSVDGRLDLYKNGTAAGNIIDNTTFTFSAAQGSYYFTGLNHTFAAGDHLRGRWNDFGDRPQDLAIVYFFEVL